MKCLPFKSKKEVHYMNKEGIYYQWVNISSGWNESFNDQPSALFGNALFWENNGHLHRLYDKPSYYKIKSRLIDFHINGKKIEGIFKIHKDYEGHYRIL